MNLHVTVHMLFLTETQKGWLLVKIGADGVLTGNEEFTVFLPVSCGGISVFTFIDAHHCPLSESVS